MKIYHFILPLFVFTCQKPTTTPINNSTQNQFPSKVQPPINDSEPKPIKESTKKTLKLGTGEWEPFVGEKLKGGGPINEIAREILQDLNYDAKFEFTPWARVDYRLRAGEISIASCFWKSSERESKMLFGEPIVDGSVSLAKRSNDPWKFSGWDSLKGKKVGIVVNYAYDERFRKNPHYIKEEAINLLSNLYKLQSKHVDLVIEDEMVLTYSLEKLHPEFKQTLVIDPTPVYKAPCFLAVSKAIPNYQELRTQLDKAIIAYKNSPRYAQKLRESNLIR